jgi:hypothetical protein
MTNPLIDKYNEIYGKKEEPKVIKAENAKNGFELKPEFLEQLEKPNPPTPVTSNLTSPSLSTSNATGITKASSIKCFDIPSSNDAFLKIAGKLMNGTAQVTSMSMELDAYGNFSYGKKITFEVRDYGP